MLDALWHPGYSSLICRFRFRREGLRFCWRPTLLTANRVGTTNLRWRRSKRVHCSNLSIIARSVSSTPFVMDICGGIALAVGLILLPLIATGFSIAFQPTWVVRYVQKFQPEVFYIKRTEDKVVSLTIDDAPHSDITPQILDVLRENKCKATFFVIGENIDLRPDLVERMFNEGHEVANHTMKDVASWRLSPTHFRDQLIETEKRIAKYFSVDHSGRQIKWFRPGHGFYSKSMLEIAKAEGYKVALGSLFPLDTLFTAQAWLISKYLLWRMHKGAIIILHDRQPQKHQTIKVLKMILPVLKSRGYKVVTLSELYSWQGEDE
ncbi:hypothetical protein R1sor_005737 [Riccia sorocarpa]|uniref:NodB homology domain-containing protein n=1 Tax=Riccia sorocarpa TaxID=122646 RepID=A0ABD3HMG4_9MARC